MSTIHCPECGAQHSDQSTTCPTCGHAPRRNRPNLGQTLHAMAKHGMESDGNTMHAGSDYVVQWRAYAKDVQDNVSDQKLARTDALMVKVAAELMATETARAMLALAEETIRQRMGEANVPQARGLVFEAFRSAQGIKD